MVKRIILFLAVNFLVVITLSLILNLFHLQPYLSQHGLNIPSLLIFCLVWGMGGAFISLLLSRQMAKWFLKVRVVDERSERELVEMVHRLARKANLSHMPEVGIYESKEPNAFATGPSQRKALVAVSTGLLNKMSSAELEGVIAHEITHIANGDMVTMTLIQGVVNAFVMFLARILAYVFSSLGRSRDSGSGGSYFSYMMSVFFFEVIFMLLGSLVVAKFSRWREFRADHGGARLGREKMIGALEALQRMYAIKDPRTEQPALAAFKISTHEKKRGLLSYFATHPPLEVRIERLRSNSPVL